MITKELSNLLKQNGYISTGEAKPQNSEETDLQHKYLCISDNGNSIICTFRNNRFWSPAFSEMNNIEFFKPLLTAI
ncbi:MAG: hypothetical protein LBN95_03865 [Prevotellaceae bacterium]|jgi:hypothetical protein|nr:hypothetical protein [Prevotellaceae bacterium]